MPQEPNTKAISTLVRGARTQFLKIAKQSPLGVDWDSEAGFAMQALKKSDYLAKCEPSTIKDAIINVASIGLSLNPALQHAALVPRYNNRAKRVECCLDPMYRGLIHLAIQGGQVISVRADVVREADQREGNFQYISGTEPAIIHTPNPFASVADRGPIVGAYVVAEIKGSKHPHVTTVSLERLHQIRNMSETFRKYNKGAWVDHEDEMFKKTAVKMGSKTWGTGNVRMQTAIVMANTADGFDGDTIEGEATVIEPISAANAKIIRSRAKSFGVKMEKIYDVYTIKTIEELPAAKFDECLARVNRAGAARAVRNAKPGEAIFAEDYGITFKMLSKLLDEFGATNIEIL